MNRIEGICRREHGTYTDAGGAQRFVEIFGDDFKWCDDSEHWMKYDEKTGLWAVTNNSVMVNKVAALANMMEADINDVDLNADDEKEIRKFAKDLRMLKTAKPVLEFAKANMACKQADFNSNPILIAFSDNKVVNLITGTVTEGKKEYMFTKCLKVKYSNVCTDEFINFINTTFPDADCRVYVQKFLGSSLLGYSMRNSNDKKALFITSVAPDTGKSTLLTLLEKTLGSYFVAADVSLITDKSKDSNKPSPQLAELQGAKIAAISEIGADVQMCDDKIKKFTGGDTVGARFPYDRKIFYYKPDFRILIVSNSLPRAENNEDIALRARLRIITLNETIKNMNTHVSLLFDKDEFASSFVKWLVDGCKLYQSEGLDDYDGRNLDSCNLCENMKMSLKKYFEMNDEVGDFFSTFYKITKDSNDYIPFSEVYTAWKEYTDDKSGFYKFCKLARTSFTRLGLIEKRKQMLDAQVGKMINPTCIVGIKRLSSSDLQKNKNQGKIIEVM